MIGQSHSGHGQGPRPWSRSKAMVKFQSEAERMSTRARAGNRRRRRALGARCGGNQDFFSVSSNPGRGGKNFFFEKSMENFFFGSKRVGDNGMKSVSWGFGWEVFLG